MEKKYLHSWQRLGLVGGMVGLLGHSTGDDKTKKGYQDRSKVDSQDPSEVEYVHQLFKNQITHEQALAYVKKYGPGRQNIYDGLTADGLIKRVLLRVRK